MQHDDLIKFLVTVCIGCLTAYLAKGKGRNPILWFFIGTFFGIFGLLALFLFRGRKKEEKEKSSKENISLPDAETKQESVSLEPSIGVKTLKEQEWFYLDAQHQQSGPVAFTVLESMWKEGKITQLTYVWSEGMTDWHVIKDLPLLRSFFD